jgi:hypothetical protein
MLASGGSFGCGLRVEEPMRSVFCAAASVMLVMLIGMDGSKADFFSNIGRQFGGASDVGRAIEKATQDVGKAVVKINTRSIKEMSDDLHKLDDASLYILRGSPDVCATVVAINCGGLGHPVVKPLVDLEIDHRRAEEAQWNTRNNFFISVGGLVVSLFSLCVSIYSARIKKKDSEPPSREPTTDQQSVAVASS